MSIFTTLTKSKESGSIWSPFSAEELSPENREDSRGWMMILGLLKLIFIEIIDMSEKQMS